MNFENRLAFRGVTGKNKVAPFFRTRGSYVCFMSEIERRIFCHQNNYSSTAEAIQVTRNLQPAVQDLFPVMNEYMKLLLVNPASSATAERIFGSLRRLKTWLRNSMCQMRLNSCAVCSAHVEALDNTDITKLATAFVSRVHMRENIFGKFPACD